MWQLQQVDFSAERSIEKTCIRPKNTMLACICIYPLAFCMNLEMCVIPGSMCAGMAHTGMYLMTVLQGSHTVTTDLSSLQRLPSWSHPPSILSSAEVSRSSYLQLYWPWSSARTSAMVSLWTLCSTSVLCLPWGFRSLPFLNHSDFTFGTENWHVMVQVWPSFKVTSWRCRSQAGSVCGMWYRLQ